MAADLFGPIPDPPPAPAARLRTIPQIRARLKLLARLHRLPELEDLAEETRRRQAFRKAPAKSRHLDEAMKVRVRAFAQANPKATYHEIANAHGINIGRVSEALVGVRGEA